MKVAGWRDGVKTRGGNLGMRDLKSLFLTLHVKLERGVKEHTHCSRKPRKLVLPTLHSGD